MKQILFAAAMTACLPTLALAEMPLTNDQAKAVIEKNWRGAYLHLPLGTFKLVEEGADGGPRSLGQGELARWYEPMAKTGLITIEKDAADSSVTVALTPQGVSQNASKNKTILALPYGTQSIETIKADQFVDPSHAGFRIYNVEYSIKWNDVVAKVLKLCGKAVTAEQKALVLLKYDSKEKDWLVAAEDDANQGDPYCTQNVADTVAARP